MNWMGGKGPKNKLQVNIAPEQNKDTKILRRNIKILEPEGDGMEVEILNKPIPTYFRASEKGECDDSSTSVINQRLNEAESAQPIEVEEKETVSNQNPHHGSQVSIKYQLSNSIHLSTQSEEETYTKAQKVINCLSTKDSTQDGDKPKLKETLDLKEELKVKSPRSKTVGSNTKETRSNSIENKAYLCEKMNEVLNQLNNLKSLMEEMLDDYRKKYGSG